MEGGLQHDALAGAEAPVVLRYDAHELVAEDEGWGGDRGEERRVLRGEGAQVRAADAGEKRLEAHPLGGRKLGVRDLFEVQR
jgi:hypothetical protein